MKSASDAFCGKLTGWESPPTRMVLSPTMSGVSSLRIMTPGMWPPSCRSAETPRAMASTPARRARPWCWGQVKTEFHSASRDGWFIQSSKSNRDNGSIWNSWVCPFWNDFWWFISVGNDELCSLPGWVRSGREWQSLDTKLKLEITLDQVTTNIGLPQTLINKNSCVSKVNKSKGRVTFNYSSVLAFQDSNMARMSVLRGESKLAGTRFVSNTFIRKIKIPLVDITRQSRPAWWSATAWRGSRRLWSGWWCMRPEDGEWILLLLQFELWEFDKAPIYWITFKPLSTYSKHLTQIWLCTSSPLSNT